MSGRVSAPGKLMIAGEYVVLDGAEALVAAVSARAFASWSAPAADGSPAPRTDSPDAATPIPEAMLARTRAERALGVVPMDLAIDTRSLRFGQRKLGLGSSAAAAVASAAAVAVYHGRVVDEERRQILGWALEGHTAVAPQGSGADVAASALGGLVRFHRGKAAEARTVTWPEGLSIEVIWSGEPARTSDLVAKVRALSAENPSRYEAVAGPLRDAAEALLEAVVAGDVRSAVHAAGRHGDAMRALGDAAGAPIVTPELASIAAMAQAHGGAAKPSGAGGGDVALAFFADEKAAEEFRARCLSAGLTPLPLQIGAEGVRIEET
jgi:phosphomevalonate kinase